MTSVFNVLFYFVVVLSFLGGAILFFSNKKTFLSFFSILLLCFLWRFFVVNSPSRYYSIFIIFGLFLSSFAIDGFFKRIPTQKSFSCFLCLVLILLCFHLPKVFSGFNDVYILDLHDFIAKTAKERWNGDVYIIDKETKRLSYDLNINRIRPIPSDIPFDAEYFYIKNSLFGKDVLFFIPAHKCVKKEINSSFVLSNSSKLIQHYTTNNNHNRFFSVYRHFPYTPVPDIDISETYPDAVLKAYVPEYDAFIFRDDSHIIWLIGNPMKENTEIVYHVFTDRLDLLPASRREYRFENYGFRAGKQETRNNIGKYSVYTKNIPTQYPISYIRAGFNTDGVIVFFQFML